MQFDIGEFFAKILEKKALLQRISRQIILLTEGRNFYYRENVPIISFKYKISRAKLFFLWCLVYVSVSRFSSRSIYMSVHFGWPIGRLYFLLLAAWLIATDVARMLTDVTHVCCIYTCLTASRNARCSHEQPCRITFGLISSKLSWANLASLFSFRLTRQSAINISRMTTTYCGNKCSRKILQAV